MAVASTCILRVSSSYLRHLEETLLDRQVGLTQTTFTLLLPTWVQSIFRPGSHDFACTLRLESISYNILALPKVSTFKIKCSGGWPS